jgi:uncharacterized protein (UPF0212 family)
MKPRGQLMILPLSKLKKASYNPNEMSEGEFEKLVHNIKEKGYLEYIVANKRTDYTIVSGNHRLDALEVLGYTEAEVIVVDVSLEEEKALNISFNRIGGVLNQDKVSDIILDLKDNDFGCMELTGLDDFEFDMILSDFANDPYKDELDDMNTKFKTEKEEERGTPRPKKDKEDKKTVDIKIIECPVCGEEIEI